MLTTDEGLSILANLLDAEIPQSDSEGRYYFPLSDIPGVWVQPMQDGSALIAWTNIPTTPDSTSNEEATEFLRLHLARERLRANISATCDAQGTLILFSKTIPATGKEWVESIKSLLNETEAVIRIGFNRKRPPAGSTVSLFSGMGRVF